MVAPPLSGSFFSHPKICFLFNRYPLVTRESYDFSRLGHPWQTQCRQLPRMDQLITYFQTLNFSPSLATHWAVYQFNFCQEWSLLALFQDN